jgi:hypothetical protein
MEVSAATEFSRSIQASCKLPYFHANLHINIYGIQFISGKRQFRTLNKLNRISADNIVFLARQAAMSVSYMNQQPVRQAFVQVANQVRKYGVVELLAH